MQPEAYLDKRLMPEACRNRPLNLIRGVESTPLARADGSHGIANDVLGCIPAIGLIQGVPICMIVISSRDTHLRGQKN